ncbi:MAG: tRNA lysidine(34) synthetase TilS [Rhodobacteraceae bacterium]|nr:tRNA lysidine(34) synthetase TilS [Paracoccaceae bacterium]
MAVSGGGDSLALLHAAHAAGLTLRAATVDHGLRPGSRAEALGVAAACADLGVPHDILTWHPDGAGGNLQARARDARYGLLAGWARARGLAAVAVAHTQDDQAETVVMALARAGGVDALAAMPARWDAGGVAFLRPFLGLSRAALRDWLTDRGIAWTEDPSNADRRFERVRVRQAMAALAAAGVGATALARTAAIMAEVQAALDGQVAAALAHATPEGATLTLPLDTLAALPAEVRRRVLADCLCRVAGRRDPPRGAALARLTDRVLAGQGGTLHGARVTVSRGNVRFAPEHGPDTAPAADQPH